MSMTVSELRYLMENAPSDAEIRIIGPDSCVGDGADLAQAFNLEVLGKEDYYVLLQYSDDE